MNGRTPVLWKPLFRDIHSSSDFNASKDFLLKRLWDFAGVEENAIHPHSDDHSVFDRLKMNIGGLLLHGVEQNAIDQLDNGSSRLVLKQIISVICGKQDSGNWLLGIRTWHLCSIGKPIGLKCKIDPPFELNVINNDGA